MKKLNYNSICSFQLIKNSLRRLLPLIVVSLVFCFVSLTLPNIILDEYYTKDMYLNEGIDLARVVGTFLGIITPVILFATSHKKNSVNFHFSLPLTRTQIFFSYLIVSFVILLIPLGYFFVNLLVLAGIKTALKSVAYGLILGLLTISISVFAGIVTGNTIIHMFCAIWLNFLIPSLILVGNIYGQFFLFGYSGIDPEFIGKFTPLLNEFPIKSMETAVYLIVAVVTLSISLILFKRLKLERAETGITFKSIGFVFNIIFAIYGSSMLGGLLYSLDNKFTTFMLGAVIGSAVAALVGYMFLNKSSKAFNKTSIRVMVVSAIISLLFAMTFVVDVYKFTDKVPHVADVKKVEVDLYLSEYNTYATSSLVFKENLNKQQIISIHKYIVENFDMDDTYQYIEDSDSSDTYDDIVITYTMENNEKIRRSYTVKIDDEKHFKVLFQSKEFKELTKLPENTSKYVNLYVYDDDGGYVLETRSKKVIDKFVTAYNKDVDNRSFNDYKDTTVRIYNVSLSDKDEYDYMDVYVLETDKNTLETIREVKS